MPKRFNHSTYDVYPSAGYGAASGSTTAVIVDHRSFEAVPLLAENAKRRRTDAALLQIGCLTAAFLVFFALVFTMYHTVVHFGYCPPDPSTRDAIRRGWEQEDTQHTAIQHEWQRREQEQRDMEQGWKRDAKQHEEEVIRRIDEEHARQERTRQEWAREIERHVREFKEIQRREREQRERERENWRREVAEREQREAEERERLRLFWDRVETQKCITYATREYTAQLKNLPAGWTWAHRLDACRATPLEIHGAPHLPTSCEEGQGVMKGRWVIDKQEPACATHWGEQNDKGCTLPGSGRKYVTHKLENLPEDSDWGEFCGTTPIYFDHMQFPGAQECFNTIWGVYGQWELDDSKC